MKNKIEIPKFKNLEEERLFWDAHSITDTIGKLEEIKVLAEKRRKEMS